MSETNKIAKAYEALASAQAALDLVKHLLEEATGLNDGSLADAGRYAAKAAKVVPSSGAVGKVIEGVFDGQNMVDKKGNTFPVPANYASKSKLIPGDVLKLTVTEEGKFLYKQIGPVERKTVIGPLVHKDGQYMILANGKAYRVLLASVTYFRAAVGDEVALIIPMKEDSEWGAIEAVLPKFDDAESKTTKKPRNKTSKESLEELDI
ncbi:MAG: hypothetical protein V1908_04985 [Candidatus Peregrinibacteria bacterium]